MKNKTGIVIIISALIVVITAAVVFLILKDRSYDVTFDTNGGSQIMSQKVKKGENIIKPSDPIKEGYKFLYWSIDGKEEFDFNIKISKNINLLAVWSIDEINSYAVSFYCDNELIEKVFVYKGTEVKEINPKEKSGYIFKYWSYNGVQYDFTKKVENDMKLTAVYEKKDNNAKYFTVTFDADNGTTSKIIQVKENNKVSKPSNPTKSGYSFKEWQLDGKTYNFSSSVSKNIILKAVWEKVIMSYNVIFNTDGGSNIESQLIKEGEKVVKPTNPTKSGYSFKEWQLDGKTYNFSSSVSKNITLKAIWEKDNTSSEKVSYNVYFTYNLQSEFIGIGNCRKNCSSDDTVSVEKGSKVNEHPLAQYDGYTCKEWQLNGKKFDFNTPINESITLVALCQQNKYKVTIDYGGVTNTVTKVWGEEITLYESEREGMEHLKWVINDANVKDFEVFSDHIHKYHPWVIISDTYIKEVYTTE